MNQYLPGLARLWKSPDGKQYGYPKDWDTVAVVANLGMLKDAGVSEDQLRTATWNPTDGGTFEQIAAKLSVDKNGKRGDEPGFDPKNVKTYGLALDAGGFTYGQTTWAGFARSLGFQLLNKNPWGTKYHYDDPRFAQTIGWWRHMIQKGYMPSATRPDAGPLAAVQCGHGGDEHRRRLDRRHLHHDQGHQGRLLPAAAGAAGQLEHVQRARRRDLGRAKHCPRRASGCSSSAAACQKIGGRRRWSSRPSPARCRARWTSTRRTAST